MVAERQEAVIDGIIIPERTPIIQSLFLFEPIKVDCMDDIGCPEIFSGDNVHVMWFTEGRKDRNLPF